MHSSIRLTSCGSLVEEPLTTALFVRFDGDENPARQLPAHLANMEARKEELAKHLEKLKAMDLARSKQGKDATENPAQIPKTDPDSRILPNKEGGYATNDTPMATTETQSGLIVDASVEIGNIEHTQLPSIINRAKTGANTQWLIPPIRTQANRSQRF
jgi:hypothetical protein